MVRFMGRQGQAWCENRVTKTSSTWSTMVLTLKSTFKSWHHHEALSKEITPTPTSSISIKQTISWWPSQAWPQALHKRCSTRADRRGLSTPWRRVPLCSRWRRCQLARAVRITITSTKRIDSTISSISSNNNRSRAHRKHRSWPWETLAAMASTRWRCRRRSSRVFN